MEESVKRYIIETFRVKYHLGDRREKSRILDELVSRFECHRKHATRLMKPQRPGRKRKGNKRGRKSKYDNPEFLKALHKARRVMEYRNAEVVKENMAEWLPFIEKHYGVFKVDIRDKLLSICASTIKRYVKRLREQAGKGIGTTRPGSILRNEIPIRT